MLGSEKCPTKGDKGFFSGKRKVAKGDNRKL
jgi:hypothetical protein